MAEADEPLFPEMKLSADEAAIKPAESLKQHSLDILPGPAPHSAWEEVYKDQYKQSLTAHLVMRRWAFVVAGVISSAYFVALLGVLWKFFDGGFIAAIFGIPDVRLDWHILVLIGIVFVIFAAVPLSLVMALVKMISDKQQGLDDSIPLKTPGVEAGKLLVDLFKGVTSK